MEVAQASKQPWFGLVNKAPFTESGWRAGKRTASTRALCSLQRVYPVFLDRHLSLHGLSPWELNQEILETSISMAQGLPAIWLTEVMTNVNSEEK